MPSDKDNKTLSREHTDLYHEYVREFGNDRAQVSMSASEAFSIEEIMCCIREELAAEYLKSPTKEHLRKYLRSHLESDLEI